MDNIQLNFLKELFPLNSEDQLVDIIQIVEQSSPFDSPDQKLEQIYNLLIGDQSEHDSSQEIEPEENIQDEEGAVGYGYPRPVSQAVLNQHFSNLQNIFPDADPGYLWKICEKQGANFSLDVAVEEISENGYDCIVFDANTIWEKLKEALPSWDPSYLKKQSEKLALQDPKRIEEFVNAAIENNDYPTMDDYLKRQKQENIVNNFRLENFNMDRFLENFPDPETHFCDPKHKNPLIGNNVADADILYAKIFLYNNYPDIRKRHIDLVFKSKKMILSECCDLLDHINRGLKVDRKPMQMPDCSNLELLQEVSYLKHRRLIKRVLKYRDETYRRFKEEARALNFLETCGVCAEDELIPEECFNCQKGCVFCKDCVKKYIEVRMGDGLTTFPCCNNCDSEFSLHILQMALPKRTFERLVLRIQSEEIKKANVDGLETCPFCDFASIPLENSTVFKCENEDCLKESCRLCKHESHVPKKCDEIEYDEDVRRRTYIEDMMTDALARTCHSCSKKFIKSNGCNKMVCNCGAIMCYLCSQPITGYEHFGADKTCQLFTNDAQIDLTRVREKAAEAKRELGNVKIKFDPTVGLENFYQNS